MARITIDDLATMMQREFNRIDDHFGELHTKIGVLQSELYAEIGVLRSELHTEIGALQSELHTEIDSLRGEMNSNFASIRSDISRLMHDIEDIKNEIKIERKRTIEDVDVLTKKVLKLEEDVKILKDEIKKLKLKTI